MRYRVYFDGTLAGVGDSVDCTTESVADAIQLVKSTAEALSVRYTLNQATGDAQHSYVLAVANECAWLRASRSNELLYPDEYDAKYDMITERGCVWPGPGMFFQIEVLPDGP